MEKFVGHPHTFAEQAAGILAQIEDKTLEFALRLETLERLSDLVLGSFGEAVYVHVADARLYFKRKVDAVAGYFVANDSKFEWLVGAFTDDRDVDCGSFCTLEQVGYVAGRHVVGGFTVNCGDHITGSNAGFVCRSANERSDNDDLIIPRTYRHTHAVVLAALIFAQKCVLFWIEKVGMGIQDPQHSWDSAVIDRLIRVHRLGVILLDEVINLGEFTQIVANFTVTGAFDGSSSLSEYGTHETAKKKNKENQEERATGATRHAVWTSLSAGRYLRAAANLRKETHGDENRPEASIWLSIASVLQLLCMEFRAFTTN